MPAERRGSPCLVSHGKGRPAPCGTNFSFGGAGGAPPASSAGPSSGSAAPSGDAPRQDDSPPETHAAPGERPPRPQESRPRREDAARQPAGAPGGVCSSAALRPAGLSFHQECLRQAPEPCGGQALPPCSTVQRASASGPIPARGAPAGFFLGAALFASPEENAPLVPQEGSSPCPRADGEKKGSAYGEPPLLGSARAGSTRLLPSPARQEGWFPARLGWRVEQKLSCLFAAR